MLIKWNTPHATTNAISALGKIADTALNWTLQARSKVQSLVATTTPLDVAVAKPITLYTVSPAKYVFNNILGIPKEHWVNGCVNTSDISPNTTPLIVSADTLIRSNTKV